MAVRDGSPGMNGKAKAHAFSRKPFLLGLTLLAAVAFFDARPAAAQFGLSLGPIGGIYLGGHRHYRRGYYRHHYRRYARHHHRYHASYRYGHRHHGRGHMHHGHRGGGGGGAPVPRI
ncbi:MAG: hypothetical protein ACREDM_07985 [Methylocella sp.]